MTDSVLLESTREGVRTLTLNRPTQFNAMTGELLDELLAAFDRVAADDSVRVVILAGTGKAFCAGHDLKQARTHEDLDYQRRLFGRSSEIMQRIVALPQPVIARVHGMTTAAGCQLVAGCDLAVAAEEATFAVSGVRLGLFCSTPAVALTRNVPLKQSMEMLLTGEFIDARTALECGLVNRVCKSDELDDCVNELAHNICRNPPRVVRLGKELVYRQLNQPLNEAYADATETIACNMMMDEAIEGVDAFIEKRKPRWN